MGTMEGMMEFMVGRMSKEEKGEMMDNMMDKFFADMSADDKQKMVDTMMDKFFADMSAEDRQKMMAEMMPKMMEGMNLREMMPQMMMSMMGGGGESEGGDETGMPMMANMMLTMMPQCVEMVLPETPKKERRDYVLKMVSALLEHGSVSMSEAEKDEFVAEVVEKVRI